MWEGVEDRTELQHIDPHSIGHNHVSFPFSWAAQPGAWSPASLGHVPQCSILSPTAIAQSGAWGPTLLDAGFLYRILSLTHLISNSSDLQHWISCALSYIMVPRPPSSCGCHNFALIQPVHGQGYDILIFLDRMHLLFTPVHFLF